MSGLRSYCLLHSRGDDMAVELTVPVGTSVEMLAGGEKLSLYRFVNLGTGELKIDSKTLAPSCAIDLWIKSATVYAGTVPSKTYKVSYEFLTV